jgi:hypothetical protein
MAAAAVLTSVIHSCLGTPRVAAIAHNHPKFQDFNQNTTLNGGLVNPLFALSFGRSPAGMVSAVPRQNSSSACATTAEIVRPKMHACSRAAVASRAGTLTVAPVLLGDGVRLFSWPGGTKIGLERLGLTAATRATNLRLRVVH